MAEQVYGLTAGAINALTPIVRQHKGRLPGPDQRRRKVYPMSTRFARYRITENNAGDPVAIYRTSHPTGFDAVRLANDGDTSTGPTTTIFATLASIRSVFRTNDIVWARTVNGEVQVVDFGRVHWNATANETIAPDSSGDVTLTYADTGVVVSALNWSNTDYIATDDELRVEWEDERQAFLIVSRRCSEVA